MSNYRFSVADIVYLGVRDFRFGIVIVVLYGSGWCGVLIRFDSCGRLLSLLSRMLLGFGILVSVEFGDRLHLKFSFFRFDHIQRLLPFRLCRISQTRFV